MVAGLNEALWARTAGQKLLRTARVRADTTVIGANVAYPADAGLLAKAVGKLVRAARRVQAAGGAAGTMMTGRRRAAGRRAREMALTMRARAQQGPANPQGPHRQAGRGPATRPRSPATTTASSWLTASRQATRQTLPSSRPRTAGSYGAAGARPIPSPPTAGTASPRPNGTCRPSGDAPSPSRAEPGPPPPGAPSSMPAASAPWSSSEPAAKAGSATSNADTAGTAPCWTAATERPSGAGTGYSPTTWPRSAPSPADRPGRTPHRRQYRRPRSAFRLFQVEVIGPWNSHPQTNLRKVTTKHPGLHMSTSIRVGAPRSHRPWSRPSKPGQSGRSW